MNNTFQNTNYYNDIIQAYDAGVSNNTTIKDNLIRNLNNSLQNSCKTYASNPNIITSIDPVTGKTIDIDLDSYIGKYRNNIEFSNSLREQLLADEEVYFVNKYGSAFYNYLITKRKEYLDSLDVSSNVNTEQCTNTETIRTYIRDASGNITETTQSNYIPGNNNSGNNDSSGNYFQSQEQCNNDNGLQYYDMFSKYIPHIDPNVINRKIEYREKEHDFLMKINSIMNIVYYILFFLMIILLIGGNNLQFSQRYIFYLFLLILPFLYPYVFKILSYLYNYFTDIKNIHGPKNAFLDTNGEYNLVDAYNN
jgi:hypothetical protein